MSRVSLLSEEDVPDDCEPLLTQEVLGEMNLQRARANNPPLLKMAREYMTVLKEATDIPMREFELAILSVARALESAYEWQQHNVLASTRDVSEPEVRAIGRGDISQFSSRERAVMEYAAAVSQREVTDETADALGEYYDDRTIVAITVLASHYVETAYILDALDVPLEDEFVGWVPE